MLLHHAFDILDHDNCVINHDPDSQHERQQRYRVGGVADRLEHDEGADQAHRDSEGRYQCRAHAAEEKKHHDDDKDERLDQRLFHLVDGRGDEARWIVGDLPGQVLGEALLDLRRYGRALP